MSKNHVADSLVDLTLQVTRKYSPKTKNDLVLISSNLQSDYLNGNTFGAATARLSSATNTLIVICYVLTPVLHHSPFSIHLTSLNESSG